MIEREYQEAFSPRWVIDNIEERTHELVLLRQIIPWQNLLEELSGFYSRDKGRKGISLRIMVALLLIKHLRHLSDRQVVQQVKENRYIQYFCNVPDENLSTFINRTSPLSRFRQRVGVEGVAHSEDVAEKEREGCISARSATEGFIAVAKNLRGFRKSLYPHLKGHRIWTLLCQITCNLKKFLQLYRKEEISEKSLIALGLLST